MVKHWNLKNIATLILLLLLVSFSQPEYTLIKTIPITGQFIALDNLRNTYVVTPKWELVKFNAQGEQVYIFSEKRHGRLQLVVADNPFKLVLFYPDFSTIVTLDNTLSQTGVYNLQNMNFQQVDAVCLSFDNNLWLYDGMRFQLKKIDESQKVIQESEPLNQMLGKNIKANYVKEQDNWIYLNDPDQGILVFDIYGTYEKTIPIKGLTSFQVVRDLIIYYKDGHLMSYHLKTFVEKEIPIPALTDIQLVRFQKNLLSVLRKNQLVLYSF